MSDCLILVISAPFFAFGAAFGVFTTDFGGLFSSFLGLARQHGEQKTGDNHLLRPGATRQEWETARAVLARRHGEPMRGICRRASRPFIERGLSSEARAKTPIETRADAGAIAITRMSHTDGDSQ